MRYRFKLSGLDCANCALKIEEKLKEDKNIKNSSINFSKLSLMVESNMNKDVKNYVSKIVKEIEPKVNLYDIDEHINDKPKVLKDVIRLSMGIVVSLLGMFVFKDNISKVLIIMGYFLLLFRTVSNAVKLLLKSKTTNENLLVTISCIGAYLTGNIHEGLMVIILYEIGKILEELAVNNSRKAISDLMDIKPLYANLKTDNEDVIVSPESIKINDVIVVKQGEKVPLDGIVVKGNTKLKTATLTGESKLKSVSINDHILSGSINEGNIIELKVTSVYEDSTVSRILNLVESATDRKAKTETFVSKVSKIYTPVVLILSVFVIILCPVIFNIRLKEAIYRALVFLVISCPCAIVISVPLGYFSGIGKASKNGILVKGSDYLDALGNIKKIIFDKTGTITTGSYSDYKLTIFDDKYKEKEIIDLYVKGEKLSNHPIAKGIINVFKSNPTTSDITNFKEISGKGISYDLNDKKIKIGSSFFCKVKENSNAIYLSINDKAISKLELVDGIKKDAKNTINKLKKLGITPFMFTGDNKDIAIDVAKSVGIDNVKYELLPQDKYKLLEKEIIDSDGITAFVGDGINDAPSLALANLGISMGSIGSASAIEASDVVIMTDELEKIVDGINISKYTNKIIKQNLIFAISIKILVLLLSLFGVASMWQAVFADTGVTLLTIINTTRILKNKI